MSNPEESFFSKKMTVRQLRRNSRRSWCVVRAGVLACSAGKSSRSAGAWCDRLECSADIGLQSAADCAQMPVVRQPRPEILSSPPWSREERLAAPSRGAGCEPCRGVRGRAATGGVWGGAPRERRLIEIINPYRERSICKTKPHIFSGNRRGGR